MKNNISSDFIEIIKCLEKDLEIIDSEKSKINEDIKKWGLNITVLEIRESLNLIYEKITKWESDFNDTGDILCIDLNEYDIVAKEASYLLGETSIIDELHSEKIDWIIGKIGVKISDELKIRRKN